MKETTENTQKGETQRQRLHVFPAKDPRVFSSPSSRFQIRFPFFITPLQCSNAGGSAFERPSFKEVFMKKLHFHPVSFLLKWRKGPLTAMAKKAVAAGIRPEYQHTVLNAGNNRDKISSAGVAFAT